MTEQGQPTRVSRRTIAKGAAWAVPVVPLVVATPAYAQTGCVPSIDFSEDSCRCTGVGQNDKNYFVKICFSGTVCPGTDGSLYVAIRANTGNDPKDLLYPSAIEVPATQGACSEYTTFVSGNSSVKLRLYYGNTAAEALSPTNQNYVIVDAPGDCETIDAPLGTCVAP